MFWKFPESVKCARLRLAHLTNSGNFKNINTPAEPLPGHPAPEIKAMSELSALGEASKKKTFVLGDLSQMWVGRVADSRTRPNPLKTPPNHRENHLFQPEFHLSFSQISQKSWGGLVNIFGKDLPKKTFFLDAFPKRKSRRRGRV